MIDKLWKFFTSLKLTVVLLALAMILVFFGTLAQVQEGLWNAQERWFKSFFIWVTLPSGRALPVFPAGYLVGILLLLNLIAAHIKRFDLRASKLGINLTHFGVILLLVGQLATDKFASETFMSFREGETRRHTESAREYELVFTRPLNEKEEEVVAIPAALLKDGAAITNDKLPFTVKVKEYWINSELNFRAPMAQNAPPLTTHGIAKDWDFSKRNEAKGMDDTNFPTAILEVSGKQGDLGTWVVPSWATNDGVAANVRRQYAQSVGAQAAQSIADKLTAPQEISSGGVTWRMALRSARTYNDFAVTLLKTTHEVYPGTITSQNPRGIPKNFKSRVRIDNSATGEKREVDIYMNNPLRYQGLTFYQSSMGAVDDTPPRHSGLQVVRNPSWQTPYWGCLVVALGMLVQFGYHLTRFISKRRSTAATA